jgi:hypothetical protein
MMQCNTNVDLLCRGEFKIRNFAIQIIVFFTFEELGHGYWCRSLVSLVDTY